MFSIVYYLLSSLFSYVYSGVVRGRLRACCTHAGGQRQTAGAWHGGRLRAMNIKDLSKGHNTAGHCRGHAGTARNAIATALGHGIAWRELTAGHGMAGRVLYGGG